jgi:hypothetical protein
MNDLSAEARAALDPGEDSLRGDGTDHPEARANLLP